jgi:IclR family pca regulon transcriptional regulator
MSSQAKKPVHAAKAERPRDFVGAVVHVMNVLKAFDAEHAQMTLAEVAKRAALDRAGARRYLITLAHLGYVVQDGKLFRLASKVLELGYSYLAQMPLSAIAQPYLDKLTTLTGDTSAVAVLDGDHIVHVAKANTNRMLAPTVTVGRPFKALYTSTGRVLLAFQHEADLSEYVARVEVEHLTEWSMTNRAELAAELRKIRSQSYAIANQEIEAGIRSIAVPIFNGGGKCVAAVSVITMVASASKKRLTDEFLPILRTTASELTAALTRL